MIVCGLLLLISIIYPLLLVDFFDALSLAHPEIIEKLKNSKNYALFFFIVNLLIGLALSFVAMIFVTHKVAGPVYKMRVYFQRILETNQFEPLSFRDGDHFIDLADDISQVAKKLQDQVHQREELVKEIMVELESMRASVSPNHQIQINMILKKLDEIEHLDI